jgi:putative SOS response-associated peptidase YedK
MCGRFTLAVEPEDLMDAFPEFHFPAQGVPRYNVAPGQPILALPNNGTNQADFFIWGLIPSWAKDPSVGNRMINARSETLAEKPSFRSAYKYHRCLIFADGFYEWQTRPGSKSKIPFFIHLRTGTPFSFAGLWEQWQTPDGSMISSAAIITTQPNQLMASIHNRMPVILQRDNYLKWLDPAPQTPNHLQNLLGSYPEGEMEAFPVSPLVNKPANDRAECILPVNGLV